MTSAMLELSGTVGTGLLSTSGDILSWLACMLFFSLESKLQDCSAAELFKIQGYWFCRNRGREKNCAKPG